MMNDEFLTNRFRNISSASRKYNIAQKNNCMSKKVFGDGVGSRAVKRGGCFQVLSW
jgi:hypothetical protein